MATPKIKPPPAHLLEVDVLVHGVDDDGDWNMEVLGGEHDGRKMCFTKNSALKKCMPGSVYLTELTLGEGGNPKGQRGEFHFQRMYEDATKRSAIQLRHRSSQDFIAARAQAKKFDINEVCPGFDNLRKVYQTTNHQGRAALEARILRELRS